MIRFRRDSNSVHLSYLRPQSARASPVLVPFVQNTIYLWDEIGALQKNSTAIIIRKGVRDYIKILETPSLESLRDWRGHLIMSSRKKVFASHWNRHILTLNAEVYARA